MTLKRQWNELKARAWLFRMRVLPGPLTRKLVALLQEPEQRTWFFAAVALLSPEVSLLQKLLLTPAELEAEPAVAPATRTLVNAFARLVEPVRRFYVPAALKTFYDEHRDRLLLYVEQVGDQISAETSARRYVEIVREYTQLAGCELPIKHQRAIAIALFFEAESLSPKDLADALDRQL